MLLSEEGAAVGCGWATAAEQDACALLGAAGLDDGEQLSLTLCDDAHITELNCQWRGIDAPTDVLSFPIDDPQLLGDLVSSVATASRQAKERSYGLRDELRVRRRCSRRTPCTVELLWPTPSLRCLVADARAHAARVARVAWRRS